MTDLIERVARAIAFKRMLDPTTPMGVVIAGYPKAAACKAFLETWGGSSQADEVQRQRYRADARAAIKEVAAWLRDDGNGQPEDPTVYASDRLKKELERTNDNND